MKNVLSVIFTLFTLVLLLTACSDFIGTDDTNRTVNKEDEIFYETLLERAESPKDAMEIFNENNFSEEFLNKIASGESTNSKIGLISSDNCSVPIFVQLCKDPSVIDFFMNGDGNKEYLCKKAKEIELSEEQQKQLLDTHVVEISNGVLDNSCLTMNSFIYAIQENCVDMNNPDIQSIVYQRIVDRYDELDSETKHKLLELNHHCIDEALIYH